MFASEHPGFAMSMSGVDRVDAPLKTPLRRRVTVPPCNAERVMIAAVMFLGKSFREPVRP